jgi:hypothetical protein
MLRVLVITDSPSPYQVELFNAVSASGEIGLEVLYVRAAAPERQPPSGNGTLLRSIIQI